MKSHSGDGEAVYEMKEESGRLIKAARDESFNPVPHVVIG
jgi:hypothetical protein